MLNSILIHSKNTRIWGNWSLLMLALVTGTVDNWSVLVFHSWYGEPRTSRSVTQQPYKKMPWNVKCRSELRHHPLHYRITKSCGIRCVTRRPKNGWEGEQWVGSGCVRYKVRPCRARVLTQGANEKQKSQEYDKFCQKIHPYNYRCQPLIGNKIAANFGNIDSSNKHRKPALSCNVNKATK